MSVFSVDKNIKRVTLVTGGHNLKSLTELISKPIEHFSKQLRSNLLFRD